MACSFERLDCADGFVPHSLFLATGVIPVCLFSLQWRRRFQKWELKSFLSPPSINKRDMYFLYLFFIAGEIPHVYGGVIRQETITSMGDLRIFNVMYFVLFQKNMFVHVWCREYRSEERADILQNVADALVSKSPEIMLANEKDIKAAKANNIAAALLNRLKLTQVHYSIR